MSRSNTIATAVLTIVLASGCSQKWTCDLTEQLKQRAGTSAKDCGEAEGDASMDVDSCVTAMFGKGDAFYAEYPVTGTTLTSAVAYDGNSLTILKYDSDPSGGSSSDPTINAWACVSPSIDTSAPTKDDPQPVSCTKTAFIAETCGGARR
ncbi:MAG TPA: hypothetical protein VH062_30550 [Polyangiaceae bacterium]|jgi:hypothetical protein|nr:hypothetical protein [Polyangiaceae bacterium]